MHTYIHTCTSASPHKCVHIGAYVHVPDGRVGEERECDIYVHMSSVRERETEGEREGQGERG